MKEKKTITKMYDELC